MITIDYDNEVYEMPSSLDELTIDKYMEISMIETGSTYKIDIIEILTGIPKEKIMRMKLNNLKTLIKSISFIHQENVPPLVNTFYLDGVRYGFNNNLNDISVGEYIDLEENSKDIKNSLHILMAILYRPIKYKTKFSVAKIIEKYIYNKDVYKIKEYDDDGVMERAELFKEKLTMDKVIGAMFFFMILRMIYTKNTQKSMTLKEMEKETMNMMDMIGLNTGGH